MRVPQARREIDLTQEPLRTERRRDLVAEHFDRHFTVMLEIFRQIDRGHTATTELPLDRVAAGECGGKVLELSHPVSLVGDVG
jgi:hypothetical protein